MAKKKPSSEETVEQYGPEAKRTPRAEEVVEYDPEAAAAADEAKIAEAEVAAGTFVPEEGYFDARDELEAKLGGFEAVAAAAVRGAPAGPLGMENIMGIGVGLKSSAGAYTGEVAVKVFVQDKVPVSRLSPAAVVPAEVNGYATDVEPIGEIVAQSYSRRYPRPAPCGVSCGHVKITAGTIGCLVVLDNNRLCLLSNNHILANENDAKLGDPIIQPGRVDGGRDPDDRIGVLERFLPIQIPGPNLVDAAAAWTSFSLVKAQHVTYKMAPNPLAPSLGLAVMKNGRTTQATLGVIMAIGVNDVRVRFTRGVALFNNQIIIHGIVASFSQGGDSGSVIVAAHSRQPVGLLFAGSTFHTIANPIAVVQAQLGISRFVAGA